jgi:hypothetical protein
LKLVIEIGSGVPPEEAKGDRRVFVTIPPAQAVAPPAVPFEVLSRNGITTTPTSFTSTSATFSELEAGTLYRVIITAVNTYASISSAIFIATTRPSQPTSLNLSNASASGFTINWLGSIGATSFTYSLNGNLAIPVSETSNSVTFTGLSPGISYTCIVIANNSIIPFDSNASAPFIAITTPSQPTSLVASNIQTTGLLYRGQVV